MLALQPLPGVSCHMRNVEALGVLMALGGCAAPESGKGLVVRKATIRPMAGNCPKKTS